MLSLIFSDTVEVKKIHFLIFVGIASGLLALLAGIIIVMTIYLVKYKRMSHVYEEIPQEAPKVPRRNLEINIDSGSGTGSFHTIPGKKEETLLFLFSNFFILLLLF
jgi:hypothetical protein